MSAPAERDYIPRREEALIRAEADRVGADGVSRAVLVYGTGGVGKTTLVQTLARSGGREDVAWLRPIDVDDSEYWLLSNLETVVARALDPGRAWFGPYFERLARLPRHTDDRAGYETVLTHLGRINRTFVECYHAFTRATGRTVVITLDTVEAVRSMYLLLTLTQWMKRLPSTLFVLAGRPLARPDADPIRQELADPHDPLEFTEIGLAGFDDAEATRFLDSGPLRAALSDDEKLRIVTLTGGQPLWLALAVEYLQVFGVPPEMTAPASALVALRERFRRRLVTLYRSTEFWPEAIKRLAVVRHSVNQDVWQRLMADRALPADAATWDEAWELLLRRPWVRPRANQRYVTLHDALAEELGQRLIPLHDQDEAWQRAQWRRARDIYTTITASAGQSVAADLDRLTAALSTSTEDEDLVGRVVELDAEKRELDQMLTARLHYAILDDFPSGTDLFLALCDRAEQQRDPLFMELICHEMERFMPRGAAAAPLEDVLRLVVRRFQQWLADDAPERHVEIAIRIAGFLIRNEQAVPALQLLENLPDEGTTDARLRYRLANERGNACMRIVGRVPDAEAHFRDALEQAREFAAPDDVLGEAEAHKELGFYYRNLGRWREADEAYQTARDVLSGVMGPGSPPAHRGEMASIQTNWAYLKALRGSYREARNLVDSAINVRQRFGQRHGEGVSSSVSGEVYRYESKYIRAWAAYRAAEEIFHELKSWPWLGQVYQEQAICLHQATREGISVLGEGQLARAAELIRQALDICRESAIRSYPSALNRAGRIFAVTDGADVGLAHLDEGIDEARRIGDGWFFSANLIEYLELSYRTWVDRREDTYRAAIHERAPQVQEAIATYGFPDLDARWELLQGHLIVHDALVSAPQDGLNRAVRHYSRGFRVLADERVGSHGSAAIAREFDRFRKLFEQLPQEVQRSWFGRLLKDWSAAGSTSLLARLEELY